jgi:tRNA nucleotidyltransferase/poly(A) polymerase
MLKKTIQSHLRSILRLSKSHKSELYIVGGTLRDLILDRQCSDFDFAVRGASILATQYAHDTKSTLVPLDITPRRETFRVVIKKNVHFDFSELQGNTIESDLSQRDFSINALAVSLPNFIKGTKKYIDPHNGESDMKNKVIRVLPGPIFSKDPLRMLRAFRFMSVLEFQIESNTLKKIKTLRHKINQVSPERIWSELTILLNSKKASPSIQVMSDSGLLESVFPELFKKEKIPPGLRILNHLESLLSNPKQIRGKPLTEIKKFLLEKPQLIRLGSMLYPVTKKSFTKQIGSNRKPNRKTNPGKILAELRASNADIDFVGAIISCSHSAANTKLNFADDHSSRLKLYQFIHQNEQGLVPGLFLHLANRLNLPAEKEWQTDPRAIAVRNIFDFYFQTYLPAKRKKPLLNGNDIQDISKIKPGPTLATILYKIEEARVLGVINTRSQAISFAKNIVRKTQKETN